MNFFLEPEMKENIPNFSAAMQLQGCIYRELDNRRTQRIELANKNYFIKQHFGVGWKEIIKNLLQLRLPVISAKNEWQAIQRLQHLAIPTLEMVGYGCRGINPARRESFLITREITQFITLEEMGKKWKVKKPLFGFKKALIQEVARIAGVLHRNGVNHRDFYICHFLLDLIKYSNQTVKLYLIDLHRAQVRKKTPVRWIIKDLAGLFFSSKEMGLTSRDLLRFIKTYHGYSLREILNKEKAFWLKVKKRGNKLYEKHAS